MDWSKLSQNNCPECGNEMQKTKKKWNAQAKEERIYWTCWDCDFNISDERKEQIIYDLRFGK